MGKRLLLISILLWFQVLQGAASASVLVEGDMAYAEDGTSGYFVTSDLWIRAVIQTVEAGAIDAVWKEGGEATTSAGDRVAWGYFYASPDQVTWGSGDNPDLYVKIWLDHGGRVDVNFFHVSVPDIEVYSAFPGDGTYDQQGTTTMDDRYIRHEYWREAGVTFVVVDTGQTVCYGAQSGEITCPQPGQEFYGQDAQYNGPQPSYQDNGDGTVTDLNTGLIWQRTPPGDHYSWDDASTYAENLELAGYTDWRVPTIKELYSLTVFYGNINTLTPYIDTDYFDFDYPDTSQGYRIIDGQYWSSNKYVGTTMNGDISAFGFNFADGRIKSYPTGEGGGPTGTSYIRCVRGGDGYGENNYADNGDGTITDLASGLMWMQTDSTATMNWEQALYYAETLEYGGYDDWRLPNAKELQSIVDYTRAPDALDPAYQSAAIDPIFDLTETESWFWSSTTHNDNGFGIYLCFGRAFAYDRSTGAFTLNAHGAGAQRSDPKSGDPADYPEGLGPQADQIRITNYVRCVRSG